MEYLNQLREAIFKGNLPIAIEMTKTAIENGCEPQNIINDYMSKAMEDIGQEFEEGKAFVPQLLMSARAMKGAMEQLKPLMVGNKVSRIGTVVIGTVKGDLHDIGKNLVASMLEGCGFEVVNLGIDVSVEKFVNAVTEHNADIVCLSALLTTTMPYMKEVIDGLEKSGLRSKVKVMIGGAPVSNTFANEVKADAYSSNANAAVATARKLLVN